MVGADRRADAQRAVPEGQRGHAALTVGLGHKFVAGETVDLAIETMWVLLPAVEP